MVKNFAVKSIKVAIFAVIWGKKLKVLPPSAIKSLAFWMMEKFLQHTTAVQYASKKISPFLELCAKALSEVGVAS